MWIWGTLWCVLLDYSALLWSAKQWQGIDAPVTFCIGQFLSAGCIVCCRLARTDSGWDAVSKPVAWSHGIWDQRGIWPQAPRCSWVVLGSAAPWWTWSSASRSCLSTGFQPAFKTKLSVFWAPGGKLGNVGPAVEVPTACHLQSRYLNAEQKTALLRPGWALLLCSTALLW